MKNKLMKFLISWLVLILIPIFAQSATQTINTIPSADASMMSDLQTFLSDESADREQLYPNNNILILSGCIGATSASLSHTITECTGFPNGYYTYQAATAHTYDASKTTFVYLRDDTTRIITIAGAAITYDDNLVFASMTLGTSQPTPPTGCLSLMEITTNGTAITTVDDLRALNHPFDTIKKLTSANVEIGKTYSTQGYYSIGDGGGGDYLIVSGDSSDGYTNHSVNGGAATARLIVTDIIDVRQAGAVMDGTVDGTASLISALANSDNVLVPEGTLLYSAVPIPSNKVLQGVSRELSILKRFDGANTNGLKIIGSNSIYIKNLAIDGNTAGNTAGNNIDISLVSSDIHISDCDVYLAPDMGIYQGGTGTDIHITGCSIRNNGFDGIALASAARSVVSGNKVTGNARYGILSIGIFAQVTDNVVTGNSKVMAGGSGISCTQGSDYSIISGNISTDNGLAGSIYAHGIGSSASDYLTITDNFSQGNSGNGIDLTTDGVDGCVSGSIINNVVLSNLDNGIAVDSQSHAAIVSGNQVKVNGNAGIAVYASAFAVISDNSITDNGQDPTGAAYAGAAAKPYGISLNGFSNGGVDYYSNDCIITGNLIQSHGYAVTGTGIHVTAGVISPELNLIITNNKILNNTVATVIPDDAVLVDGSNQGYTKPATLISLASSWVAYDATWNPPSYRLGSDGVVRISGSMKSGTVTAGTVIGTIPVGFRPSKVVGPFAVYTDSGYSSLYVSSNGEITAQAALNATRTSLDGISWSL